MVPEFLTEKHRDPNHSHLLGTNHPCSQVNHDLYIWGFPKLGVPQNGWLIGEIQLKWMI